MESEMKTRNKRTLSNMMLLYFFLQEDGIVCNPKIVKRQNRIVSFCSDFIEIEDYKMNMYSLRELSTTFEKTLEMKLKSIEQTNEALVILNEDDFVYEFHDEEIDSNEIKRYDYLQKEEILFNAISSILIRIGYQLVYYVDDKIQKKSTKRFIDGIVDLHGNLYLVEENVKTMKNY